MKNCIITRIDKENGNSSTISEKESAVRILEDNGWYERGTIATICNREKDTTLQTPYTYYEFKFE